MKQKEYNKKYFIDRDHMDLRMGETIIMLMQKNKFSKVLDIGCGTGRFVEYLNNNGFDAYGIDYSDEAVKFAKKITHNKVLKASAEKLPFKNKTFDLVISISVIEHLTAQNVEIFLKESHRILKKRGIIFLVTPNFITPFRIIQGRNWFGYSDPTHINFYSPFKLSKVLKKNSFINIKSIFKTKYNIPFDWDLPNSFKYLPRPLRSLLIYLLFSSPLMIIRNSFWMSGQKNE